MLQSIFEDVRRMNKRQVNLFRQNNCLRFLQKAHMVIQRLNLNLLLLAVPISSSQLWHDRVLGLDDMERSNGCNGERKSHCCCFKV